MKSPVPATCQSLLARTLAFGIAGKAAIQLAVPFADDAIVIAPKDIGSTIAVEIADPHDVPRAVHLDGRVGVADKAPIGLTGPFRDYADHLDHAFGGARARSEAAASSPSTRWRSSPVAARPSTALGQKRKPRSCVVACAARGRSMSVTRAARSCSPASQSWPATKPPGPRQPGQGFVLRSERREPDPAAVLAGDVRKPTSCARSSQPSASQRERGSGRLTLDLERQPVAADDAHPLAPRAPSSQCARQSSPWTRT